MGMYYEAYQWDPAQAKLHRLKWRDATFVISRSDVQQDGDAMRTTYRQPLAQPAPDRMWKERYALWQYRDGALQVIEEGDAK